MQVFKAFFMSIRRQRIMIMIYFVVFIVLMGLMLHFNSRASITDFKTSKIDVAVFDHDQTEVSQALYNYIEQTQNLVTIEDDRESIADNLFFREVQYVLIIPEGFHNDYSLLENVKLPDSTDGYFLDQKINEYVRTLDAYQTAGYSDSTAIQMTMDSLDQSAEVIIQTDTGKATGMTKTAFFFQYLPYFFLAIIMTTLGSILAIFRQKDLKARIQCSSMSITSRNFQMILACITFGVLTWFTFMILGAILSSSTFFSFRTVLYGLNSFVTMIFTLSLTYLISFFVTNDDGLNLVANVAGLGASFLSGIFVPLEILSPGVKQFSHFLPSYWYVLANNIVTNYSGNATQFAKYFQYLGVQLLFIVVFFAAALVASKYKKTA